MTAEDLDNLVNSLTPEEQEAVDEFIEEHPELLRRLAR